jgi:hypothetical protein
MPGCRRMLPLQFAVGASQASASCCSRRTDVQPPYLPPLQHHQRYLFLHGPVANKRAWTRVRPVLRRANMTMARPLCQPHSLNAVMRLDELHPLTFPVPHYQVLCVCTAPATSSLPASALSPHQPRLPPVIPAPTIRRSPNMHMHSPHTQATALTPSLDIKHRHSLT